MATDQRFTPGVPRPLKVAYVSPGGVKGRGGMGRMARYLAAVLPAQTPPVHCRVLDSYGPGPFWRMPFQFALCSAVLFGLCLTRRVDVVHLHMSVRGSAWRKLALLRLAGWFGVPVMLHLHGSEFEVWCRALSARGRERLVTTMARASRIIVIGEFWRRFLVDDLGLPERRVVLVHNGVPLPEKPTTPAAAGPCHILTLGLLGPRKGTPELLRALADPALAGLDWRATIAGNGPVETYRQEALQRGLGERVALPGWVDEDGVRRLLAEADLFVLPSHNEGLPVAILEAMAAGLPVVTTAVGAIPDLVVEGQTGTMVPPGTVEPLAAAIATLVASPERRKAFGQAGRARVAAGFTIDATAARVAALYGDLAHD